MIRESDLRSLRGEGAFGRLDPGSFCPWYLFREGAYGFYLGGGLCPFPDVIVLGLCQILI